MSSTTRPRAFCELPAGLASVSLRLHGGPHCRPPISRMGNKAGYAEVILAALGLRSGQGAGAYVWAEADPDVRALLRAYPDPEMLRRIADIIRGWKDEEPRALWERLRAERKARGPAIEPADVGGWMFDVANAHGGTGGWKVVPTSRPNTDANMSAEGLGDACQRLAEYAQVVASNRLIPGAFTPEGEWVNTGIGGATFGGEAFATPAAEVAQGFERVAGWALLGQWAYRRGVPESGFNAGLLEDREPTETGGNGAKARTCEQEAGLWEPAIGAASGFERVAGWLFVTGGSMMGEGTAPFGGNLEGWENGEFGDGTSKRPLTARLPDALARQGSRWPPVAVLSTLPNAAELSAMLGTPGDLDGVVVYMDPPYVGTTGYLSDLPREDVVRLAREYDAAGAVVCISEAEPVIDGWHAIDIAAGRKGQKRTFSKQQREVLTMNREPAHRVAVQASLFGAA